MRTDCCDKEHRRKQARNLHQKALRAASERAQLLHNKALMQRANMQGYKEGCRYVTKTQMRQLDAALPI